MNPAKTAIVRKVSTARFCSKRALYAARTAIWGSLRIVGVLSGLFVNATQSAEAQAETVLYGFIGPTDGAYPTAGLVRDKQGNLYGTTSQGGGTGCGNLGCGTVFKLTPSGTLKVLYGFTGKADGATPYAGLILDTLGNLYGTTAHGGAFGNGAVFEITAAGMENVLYGFSGGADGGAPTLG